MTLVILSARLRATIRKQLGGAVLIALEAHLEDVANGSFDPQADWQITQILELSEAGHRLRDVAMAMESVNPLKIEAMRVARLVLGNFWDVYEVAMRRIGTQPNPYRNGGGQ